MWEHVVIIDPERFLEEMEKLNCGQRFASIDPSIVQVLFSEVKAPEDFKLPTHPDTGEPHPNCCDGHQQFADNLRKWFEKFPDCCKYHKPLLSKGWFDKEVYRGTVEKVLNQTAYTEFLIADRIDNEDWYEDITDYIEYNVSSFGQLPPECGNTPGIGHYVEMIKQRLESEDWRQRNEIPDHKAQRLADFTRAYTLVDKEEKAGFPDMNVLSNAYEKWLKAFPFELPFFQHLKPYFQQKLPFLVETPKVNRYTRIAKAKTHTKEGLIGVLERLTDQLLTEINSLVWYESDQLSEPEQLKVQLAVKKRRLELGEGYASNSADPSQRYRKGIKKWLKHELAFLEAIIPTLEHIHPTEKNDRPSLKVIALVYAYQDKTISRSNADEIANKYGYKSGEKLYHNFNHFQYRSNRVGRPDPFSTRSLKARIKLLSDTAELLAGPAKQQALDEIQLVRNHLDSE